MPDSTTLPFDSMKILSQYSNTDNLLEVRTTVLSLKVDFIKLIIFDSVSESTLDKAGIFLTFEPLIIVSF